MSSKVAEKMVVIGRHSAGAGHSISNQGSQLPLTSRGYAGEPYSNSQSDVVRQVIGGVKYLHRKASFIESFLLLYLTRIASMSKMPANAGDDDLQNPPTFEQATSPPPQ